MAILSNVTAILAVVFGLGFVIFIHELGHFLLAKWNGVKVEKFAIGFDIYNLKLWSRTIGETTYVLGALPLGGYVKMLGEDMTGTDGPSEPIADPRAYPNKPVGARMAIISAGVVMNLIFGLACFTYVYLRGKMELMPVIGAVDPGMPAYEVGLRPGDRVIAVNGRNLVRYFDLQQAVIFAGKGQPIRLRIERPGAAEPIEMEVVPRLRANRVSQTIGIAPASDLELSTRLPFLAPAGDTGDPKAVAALFDRVGRASELTAVEAGPEGGPLRPLESHNDYERVLAENPDRPLTVRVRVGAEEGSGSREPAGRLDVTLAPARVVEFGLRMTPGPVSAVRRGGPAAQAGIVSGDRIVSVESASDFDPMRLPDLAAARAAEGRPLVLEVEGGSGNGGPTTRRVVEVRPEPATPRLHSAPTEDSVLEIEALGLSMEVGPRVAGVVPGGPAARAGFRPGDVIHAAILAPPGLPSKPEGLPARERLILDGRREARSDVNASWPGFFDRVQELPLGPVEFRLEGSDRSLTVTPEPDPSRAFPRRGLRFLTLVRKLPPQNLASALRMAWGDTTDAASSVLLIIRGLTQGTLTKDSVGGFPKIVEIANESARAGPDVFVPFLGMLSINLAVINFLPIPPLDGGQLLFLILEKIRGRPVPERFVVPVMITGLAFILMLMLFVNVNDVLSYFRP